MVIKESNPFKKLRNNGETWTSLSRRTGIGFNYIIKLVQLIDSDPIRLYNISIGLNQKLKTELGIDLLDYIPKDQSISWRGKVE